MSARLTVFFAGVGSFAVGTIVLANASRQFVNEHEYFVALSMILGLATVGISLWMLDKGLGGPSEKIATSLSPQAPILTDDTPTLPQPISPTSSNTPVTGTMRVDITRSEKTVDVWVQLSEEAKFIVQSNGLDSLAVEENFDRLKEHMETFSQEYDVWSPDTTQYRDPDMQIEHELAQKTARQMQKDNRPRALKEEIERYKREHTVRLADYLKYPHRHVISAPYQANIYLDQLEKKYLPLIKAAIDLASSSRHEKTKTLEY